jgi:Zn-finger nucleic acid-binding protein
MQAGILNCPCCGAAVSVDLPQCQYCHALLQTVACPKCMGMMFLGSKFCPHCGARTEEITPGPNSNRTCPRCSLPLEDVKVTDTPLEECMHCGGIWIDITEFEFLCSNAEAQQAATGLRIPPPVPTDPKVRYLKCPQCANLMNRMNYAGCSGIVINVCGAHGIWLDRDRMRQIIEFIRTGSLDRARSVENQNLERARHISTVQYTQPVFEPENLPFNAAISSDDRIHLLRGLASLANHFLGANKL